MNRRYSIKKNKEFRYVYHTGKSVSSKHIILIYRAKKSPGLRVGFSVSKKIGKSVVRNKVKRRLKTAFSSFLPNMDERYLLVFIPRPAAAGAAYREILSEMFFLLRKSGVYLEGGRH